MSNKKEIEHLESGKAKPSEIDDYYYGFDFGGERKIIWRSLAFGSTYFQDIFEESHDCQDNLKYIGIGYTTAKDYYKCKICGKIIISHKLLWKKGE